MATTLQDVFYSIPNSETLPVKKFASVSGHNDLSMTIASAIVQAKETCHIRRGVTIRSLHSKSEAIVIHPFYIELSLSEDGYVATSNIANIYELEATKGDAVRSYLYSLVDELEWLREHKEELSASVREELEQIDMFVSM